MKYLKLAAAALCVSLAGPLQAAMVQTDWHTSGDNLLIHDTSTDLKWYRLDQTFGMSHDQLTSQIGSGGSLEGLRFATLAEVETMFGHMGAPITSSYDGMATNRVKHSSIQNLQNYMGYSVETQPNSPVDYNVMNSVYGTVSVGDSLYLMGVQWQEWYCTSNAQYSCEATWAATNVFRTGLNPEGLNPLALTTKTSEEFSPYFGSWMVVEPVPVPAAVWLFGSGLIGLVGMARRKTA